jgi:hypothetical protein
MESASSLSHWDYLGLLILRPVLAMLFVFSFISIGMYAFPFFFLSFSFVCDCKFEDLIGGNLMIRLVFGMEASACACVFGSRDFRPA